ncbi:hypothetical protein C0J52_14079 [Blattella germanica]|nr:hypothetical protein C0J52_14079 [Blattella germanica]
MEIFITMILQHYILLRDLSYEKDNITRHSKFNINALNYTNYNYLFNKIIYSIFENNSEKSGHGTNIENPRGKSPT